MNCVHCGGDNSITVLVESLPCGHCGGEIRVEYNICKECGLAWKTVDGELVENATFFDMGLDELFDGDEWLKEFDMVLQMGDVKSNNMADYIHKCLRCRTVCFESGKDRWECPSCGFTWEVVKTSG